MLVDIIVDADTDELGRTVVKELERKELLVDKMVDATRGTRLAVDEEVERRGLLIDEVMTVAIIEVGYGVDTTLLDEIIDDVIVKGELPTGVDIVLGRTRLLVDEAVDDSIIAVELLITANVVLGTTRLLVNDKD